MRVLFVILALMVAAACQPAAPLATVTTPPLALTGEVIVHSPPAGAVIYSEVIHLSGTAAGVPDNAFELTLTGPDARTIATHTIHLDSSAWAIGLPHTYTGEPVEVTLTARPLQPSTSTAYDVVTIVLAGLGYRPEGVFGAITFPPDGSTTGGDQIPVGGTVSGVASHALTLTLRAVDGRVIDNQTIDLDYPSIIDEMPWSAEVNPHGYLGEATIQLEAEGQMIASIRITVDSVAG